MIKSISTETQGKITPVFRDSRFALYQNDNISLMRIMPKNYVDMIFADPPYKLSNGGFTCHNGQIVSVNKGDWDKSNGFEKDFNFHTQWMSECKRILKPNGTIWITGTYHSIYQCGFALQNLGFHILNDIIWFKPNASPNLSCRFFTASHETILWARKSKGAKHYFNYEEMKNRAFPEDKIKEDNYQMRSVWSIPAISEEEKKLGKHPTQKPLHLLKRIILASTKPGDLIFDPFNGSGTTGIAAMLIGERKYIGCEIEQNYVELTLRRYQSLPSPPPAFRSRD